MIKIYRLLVLTVWCVCAQVLASPPTPLQGYLSGGHFEQDAIGICKYLMKDMPNAAVAIASGGFCFYRNSNNEEIPGAIEYKPLYISEACMPGYTKPDKTKSVDDQCGGIPPPDNACPVAPAGDIQVTYDWSTGPKLGSAIAKSVMPFESMFTRNFCVNSCLVHFDDSGGKAGVKSCQLSQEAGPNGYYARSCTLSMIGAGGRCSGGEMPPNGGPSSEPGSPNGSPDGSCPKGSVPAGQDPSGMTICKGTNPPSNSPSTNTKTPDTTTTDAAGNKTTTSTSTNSNSDGSTTTTTTKTITAPDGTVTTVVSSDTSKSPSGGDGKSDKPEDKSDLCKQHPELTICTNSQVMGSCEQVTCTGDAIQCATLRAAATLQCRDKEDRDALAKSTLVVTGDGVMAGNDSARSQGETLWKGTSVDLSNPNLDQSGFLGGGSCFPNKSFTVAGRSVEVNFSTVCSNIQPIRYVMLLIGFILAYMIISKSILQS